MTMHTQEEILPIYAAIGPDGEVLKSSVSAFKAVAQRWAIRRRNHTVVMLAQISYHVKPKPIQRLVPQTVAAPPQQEAPKVKAEDLMNQLEPKRPRGRPRKVA